MRIDDVNRQEYLQHYITLGIQFNLLIVDDTFANIHFVLFVRPLKIIHQGKSINNF